MLEQNLCIERNLPATILRTLGDEEMAEYRRRAVIEEVLDRTAPRRVRELAGAVVLRRSLAAG